MPVASVTSYETWLSNIRSVETCSPSLYFLTFPFPGCVWPSSIHNGKHWQKKTWPLLLDSGRVIIGPYRPFLSLKSRLHPDQSLFRLRARRTLLVEHCRYDTFLSESFVPWGTVVDCDWPQMLYLMLEDYELVRTAH